VLGGDVEGKVDLRSLTQQPHLYALGPRAGVSGEITVFDGEPSVARVVDRQVHVTADADHAACFLVYDHVSVWRDHIEDKPIDDEHALQAAVLRAAGAAVSMPTCRWSSGALAGATVTFHPGQARWLALPPSATSGPRSASRSNDSRRGARLLLGMASGIFTPKGFRSAHALSGRSMDGRPVTWSGSRSGAGAVIAVPGISGSEGGTSMKLSARNVLKGEW
jgi:hypothetical protein